jgi:hypothetical protein
MNKFVYPWQVITTNQPKKQILTTTQTQDEMDR